MSSYVFICSSFICEFEGKNANNDLFSLEILLQQLQNNFVHSTINNLKYEGSLTLYHAIS